jgi:hypothetical protein
MPLAAAHPAPMRQAPLPWRPLLTCRSDTLPQQSRPRHGARRGGQLRRGLTLEPARFQSEWRRESVARGVAGPELCGRLALALGVPVVALPPSPGRQPLRQTRCTRDQSRSGGPGRNCAHTLCRQAGLPRVSCTPSFRRPAPPTRTRCARADVRGWASPRTITKGQTVDRHSHSTIASHHTFTVCTGASAPDRSLPATASAVLGRCATTEAESVPQGPRYPAPEQHCAAEWQWHCAW